jgi:phage tail-like protein
VNVIEKKDIFVRLLDEAGQPVLSWKVLNAFPKQLDAPTFTANSNEVAIEAMTLMADGVVLET